MNTKKRDISQEVFAKVLRCAAAILVEHGKDVGNQICQDWGIEEFDPHTVFTISEIDDMQYNHEIENSSLDDYEPNVSQLGDEMCASFIIADALIDEAKNIESD